MLKWVFFDIGNVLCSDHAVAAHFYYALADAAAKEGYDLSYADILAERETLIRGGHRAPHLVIASRFLDASGISIFLESRKVALRKHWAEWHHPIPGVINQLPELREQGYHLGLIANQITEAQDGLRRMKIAQHFDVVALSEDIGVKKPSPAIFEFALEKAECHSYEAVVIGERLDRDLAPALDMGFYTIWFIPGEGAAWPLSDRVDDSILGPYLESYRRASVAKGIPGGKREKPHFTVNTPEALHEALTQLRLQGPLSKTLRTLEWPD